MPKMRPGGQRELQFSVSAPAALSFLKDTKGTDTWSTLDLSNTLKVTRAEAEHVIALLAAQGYVTRTSDDQYMTSQAGESVSGARFPRFAPANIKRAIESLQGRLKEINKDSTAPFRISRAVAFGDFLLPDRARVQAADVGIGLSPRSPAKKEVSSAIDPRAESQFLKELRGKTAFLHVLPYADWMGKRSHRDLL